MTVQARMLARKHAPRTSQTKERVRTYITRHRIAATLRPGIACSPPRIARLFALASRGRGFKPSLVDSSRGRAVGLEERNEDLLLLHHRRGERVVALHLPAALRRALSRMNTSRGESSSEMSSAEQPPRQMYPFGGPPRRVRDVPVPGGECLVMLPSVSKKLSLFVMTMTADS